jgi:WD40 repeat protein
VTVGAREARVWDVASEHLIRTIDADLAALSPDGKTLFAAKSAANFASCPRPGILRAVDLATGRELRRVGSAPDEPFKLLTVSPDGTTVAVAAVKGFAINQPMPSAIVVYDAVTLAERRRIAVDHQHARDMSFSPDGRTLALGGPDGEVPQVNREPKAASVRLYDAATGVLLRGFSIEGFDVGSVAFAPDGKTLAAGIGDRTVRLYDLATGRERLPRLGREGAVPPPNIGQGATRGPGKARAAACLAFSPDGSLLASGPGWDGEHFLLNNWPKITLWDVAAAREVRRFAGHPYQICALAFSLDGERLASCGGEPQARIWDVATGREVNHRAGHPHGIVAMAVSTADRTVFTAGNDDGLVIHWNPVDGRALETLAVKPNRFLSLAISPHGRTLVIGETDELILWDVPGHKELRRIKSGGQSQPVFSPDGRTLASGLRAWDVVSGRRLDTFRVNTAEDDRYTADGRRLISVQQDGVRVWDFEAGVEVGRPIQSSLNGWFNAVLSPDGRLVATGNVGKEEAALLGANELIADPAIVVWELASGKPVAKLVGHIGQSNNLVFSPDGRMFASVSGGNRGESDPALRVWDIATGRELRRFDYHPDGANFVAFLPDGRTIVTASGLDGMAMVWDVSDLADRRTLELLDAKGLEVLWSDLASVDAPRGYRASLALSVDGAVPFLRVRLRPAASKDPVAGAEVVRSVRALAALERIGSPLARDVLQGLSRGDAASPITQDAAAALFRLSRTMSHPPASATTR